MPSTQDIEFMTRALRLARRGLNTTSPNPRVGCVVVVDGEIISEGWHQRAGDAHAEVNALNAAAGLAANATVYVTLEPCVHAGRTGPCTDALIEAGIQTVVCAMVDPNPQVAGQGIARLQAAGIACVTGVLEDEARELNPGFIRRMEAGRPFVRVKAAQSIDGRTALADGSSQWITGDAARADVQTWRARACAVLTGVGTVLADDPLLNVRTANCERQPLRIVLDPQLRTPATARLFNVKGQVLLIASQSAEQTKEDVLRSVGASVIRLPESESGFDLNAVLYELARYEINEIHVEAGAKLSGAFIRAGLVDELLLYTAPLLLGSQGRPLFDFAIDAMEQRPELQLLDQRQVGNDLRQRFRPRQNQNL